MKARIKFTKTGSMKFIGHLDVMRYFQKAFRRSGISVAYSQGYSPHQLLSFAAPLGVGLTSDGEYLDLQLDAWEPSSTMIEKLNSAMNDEIRIMSFQSLDDDSKTAMSIVAAADYKISIKDGYFVCDNFIERFLEFSQQGSITILKKTKKSEKEVDLKPLIYQIASQQSEFEEKINRKLPDSVCEYYENGQAIYMQLTTGSVINLKPELVMEAFCQFLGVPYEEYAYQVHRIDIYGDLNAEKGEVNTNDSEKQRKLITLEDFGKEIQ
jgi:radical SAM-linked protein